MKTSLSNIVLFVILSCNPALACSCLDTSYANRVEAAEFVFLGKVVSQFPHLETLQDGGLRSEFIVQVFQPIKGELPSHVAYLGHGPRYLTEEGNIRTSYSSCEFKLKTNEYYVFFQDAAPPYQAKLCTTMPLGANYDEAQDYLAKIQEVD